MHAPKCYYLQHFEACMFPNAIIYSTSQLHDADILLFARHSIRLFVVPSQYRRSSSGACEMCVLTGTAGEMCVLKPFS